MRVCVCVGVYLPLLWEQSFCWKSPIALGYTRGHFSALVAMENDGYDNRGAGANLNTDDDVTVTFLPLVDSERKLLHIHFLSAQEVGMRKRKPGCFSVSEYERHIFRSSLLFYICLRALCDSDGERGAAGETAEGVAGLLRDRRRHVGCHAEELPPPQPPPGHPDGGEVVG